ALEMTFRVYRSLGEVLTSRGFEGYLVGDEGGFGPRLQSNEQALEIILEAIDKAGFQAGRDAGIALDVASSHFYQAGKYRLKIGGALRDLGPDELLDVLCRWVDSYPILSIEDGMAEDDWQGW